jgi:uncharacterized membrane protein YkvA (DUF1232 family)
MPTLSDLVVQGGQAITAGQVDAFRNHLAAYKLKAGTLEAAGQPLLGKQCSFLLRFIEDVLDDAYVSRDFPVLPEAIFAVRYLVKGADIIPDNTAGGYSDDAAVLREVLMEHETEFRKYCSQNKIAFDSILAKA